MKTPKKPPSEWGAAKAVTSLDAYIGARIMELRTFMGFSRQEVGERIGISHQQVTKYEKGTTRISASRLHSIARLLQKPISYFFEGYDSESTDPVSQHRQMCIEVARSFMRIKNPRHQEAVSMLVHSLAREEENDAPTN